VSSSRTRSSAPAAKKKSQSKKTAPRSAAAPKPSQARSPKLSATQKRRLFFTKTIDALRAARGDSEAVKRALESYMAEGDAAGMSPYELRDYFDISSPGLAEKAGYGKQEAAEASEIFEAVSKARYT
jgi:hypothetical protein